MVLGPGLTPGVLVLRLGEISRVTRGAVRGVGGRADKQFGASTPPLPRAPVVEKAGDSGGRAQCLNTAPPSPKWSRGHTSVSVAHSLLGAAAPLPLPPSREVTLI